VLFAKLPFQFRILAKAPLWKVPLLAGTWNGQGRCDRSELGAGGVASLVRGAKTLEAGMRWLSFGGRALGNRRVEADAARRGVDGNPRAGADRSR